MKRSGLRPAEVAEKPTPSFAAEAIRADAGVRAVQSTPLIGSSGCILGIISTHRHAPWRPSDRHLRLLDLLARNGAGWIEQRMSIRPSRNYPGLASSVAPPSTAA